MIFESIIIISSLILIFMAPISICFNLSFPSIVGHYPSYVIFVFCLIEIPININTSFYQLGDLVNERTNILENYLSNKFFFDLTNLIAIIYYVFYFYDEFFLNLFFFTFILLRSIYL